MSLVIKKSGSQPVWKNYLEWDNWVLRIHKIYLKAVKRNSSNQNKTDWIEMELEVQIQKKLFLEPSEKNNKSEVEIVMQWE